MPELPEVQTVANSIKDKLIGEKILSLEIFWPKVLDNFSITDFNSKIKNHKIINVYRRAKFIIIEFENFIFAIHLRMTGKLYFQKSNFKLKKHVTLLIKTSNLNLIFEDTRKFGRIYFYENMNFLNSKLGLEPLDKEFTDKWFIKNLSTKKRQIKALLFDQSFLVGLGNIYIDEALWFAKIHPQLTSNLLSISQIKLLRKGIKKVLNESIALGGTTIRDYTYDYTYVGNYVLNLNVYGRDGLNCKRCNTLLIKKNIVQRGTHICPKCQILKK